MSKRWYDIATIKKGIEVLEVINRHKNDPLFAFNKETSTEIKNIIELINIIDATGNNNKKEHIIEYYRKHVAQLLNGIAGEEKELVDRYFFLQKQTELLKDLEQKMEGYCNILAFTKNLKKVSMPKEFDDFLNLEYPTSVDFIAMDKYLWEIMKDSKTLLDEYYKKCFYKLLEAYTEYKRFMNPNQNGLFKGKDNSTTTNKDQKKISEIVKKIKNKR